MLRNALWSATRFYGSLCTAAPFPQKKIAPWQPSPEFQGIKQLDIKVWVTPAARLCDRRRPHQTVYSLFFLLYPSHALIYFFIIFVFSYPASIRELERG